MTQPSQETTALPSWAEWTSFNDLYYAYRLIELFPECIPFNKDELPLISEGHLFLLLNRDLHCLTDPNYLLNSIADSFTKKLLEEVRGQCLSSVTGEAYIYLRNRSREDEASMMAVPSVALPLRETIIPQASAALLKNSELSMALGGNDELIRQYANMFIALAGNLMAAPHLGNPSDLSLSVYGEMEISITPKDIWEQEMNNLRFLKDMVEG